VNILDKLRKLFGGARREEGRSPSEGVEEAIEIEAVEEENEMVPETILVPKGAQYPRRKPIVVTMMSYKGGVGKSTLATVLAQLFGFLTPDPAAVIDLDLVNRTSTALLLTRNDMARKASDGRIYSVACAMYKFITAETNSIPSFDPLIRSYSPRPGVKPSQAPYKARVLVFPAATDPDFRACVQGIASYTNGFHEVATGLYDVMRLLAYRAKAKGAKLILVDLPPLRVESGRTVYDVESVARRIGTSVETEFDVDIVAVTHPQEAAFESTLQMLKRIVGREKISVVVVSGADSHAFSICAQRARKIGISVAKLVRVPYCDGWRSAVEKQRPVIPYGDTLDRPSPCLLAAATILCKLNALTEEFCENVFREARDRSLVSS